MTSFGLKILAIISMFLDHLSYAIYGHFSWLNYLGRLAFPIFAFQITEGYVHTKNFKKYLLRLGAFALISQIPYLLFTNTFTDTFTLNIFFTLFAGLLAITIFDKYTNKYLGFLYVILLAILSELLHFDYGWFGIFVIFIFYIFKNNEINMSIAFITAVCLKYIIALIQNNFYYAYYILALFTMLSIIPIALYNKKQGKSAKYFFYAFYPVHLILLCLI
ncbi:MAG: conjugal transfer protein TraX [Clostridia bacterium]|nr:conjugal transfer protein TraX [Clostridia bacterium]